jgi:diphthamide biosynthesis methyltransferase
MNGTKHGSRSILILLLQQAERILEGADKEDVAFLVVGDPFG